MKQQLIANLYLLTCSGIGICHGFTRILSHKKAPAYLHFVTFAMLSAFFSRVFYSLSIAFYGGLPDTFNIGFLGYAATFLYIFFANYGQMDLLIDDRRTLKKRYRIIPIILPAIEVAVSVISLFCGSVNFAVCVSFVIISVTAGLAAYFNVKHLIAPDIEFGIVRSIRGFNLIAVITGILSLAEIGLSVFGCPDPIIFVQAALGIMYLLMIAVLDKEMKRWTT